jgi:hypothetical protein
MKTSYPLYPILIQTFYLTQIIAIIAGHETSVELSVNLVHRNPVSIRMVLYNRSDAR